MPEKPSAPHASPEIDLTIRSQNQGSMTDSIRVATAQTGSHSPWWYVAFARGGKDIYLGR
ncbi:hypothetical protein M7I_4387 [Glarea lozoyensis 74030]|uniref:Uncharacterized protein n=1 Tax=Glarea lozoyensis (strain ATCC 74030 / MF5533) TaxID=1104152 RepID=H0EP20_GLAL7|nr:hypothetical protein M7I_4387 [Glarea lozoyensis 74030]